MTEQQIAAMIDSMCLTWRHDFGLDKPPATGTWVDNITSGMTEREREALRGRMRQLVEHHFMPALQAARASQPAPEGFVLAPVNPTKEMIKAAESVDDLYRMGQPQLWGRVFRAMINAAPTVQERTIRTHRERDAAAAIEQQREAQGDL